MLAVSRDIGHVRTRHDGAVCICGNVGCLEASASARAIATRLGLDDVEALLGRVLAADPTAVRMLRDAAIEIGEVVAMLVHFYNPASVVLGGQLARMSDDVLAGVRSIVYRRALPLATRSLTIENALHGERGGVVGGIVLGVEAALAPEALALSVANRRAGDARGR